MRKGSRNRTTDWKAYRKSMDRIARNEKRRRQREEEENCCEWCNEEWCVCSDDIAPFVPDYVKDMTE
ncbi:MAG: hypothetical protein ACYSW8_30125 [Planctomycetota bacterium]|jgi:hypothetical protein